MEIALFPIEISTRFILLLYADKVRGLHKLPTLPTYACIAQFV